MKRCGLCDYRSDSQSEFDAHMSTVHAWGQKSSVRTPPSRVEQAFVFLAGAFVWVVIDFVLSFSSFSFGSTPSGTELGQVIGSWAVTLVAFAVLYKMNRWAGYGMLGGFVGLFLLLAIGGGALGPYTCFSTYGYPGR